MASKSDQSNGSGALPDLLAELPLDRLREEFQGLGKAVMSKGVSGAGGKIESLTGKLTDVASGSGGGVVAKAAKNVAKGDSPVKATAKAGTSAVKDKVKDKVKGALGLGGGSGKKMKVTNIIEEIDVPVSRRVAYDKWTQFQDFPTFTKKVENVDQKDDETLEWKAQIFLSHRTWKATIVEQVPDERIVWKSTGEKGHVDGAVTFHELAPDLTRILVVLEYYPQGLFEKTGNLWRAPGRRFRLELKHFRRELTMKTEEEMDEIEGWRGEIRDEETVKSDEEVRKAEKRSDRSSSSAAQSSSSKKTASKKSASKRPAAKKSTAKKSSPAKKTTAKKTSAAKKSASSRGTSKRTAKKGSASKRARSS